MRFQVMDFSASQRAAHTEEYADAKILLNPGFSRLTQASQLIERRAYLEEAQSAELGCSFHFWQSATRLKANGTLIPRESTDIFDPRISSYIQRGFLQEHPDTPFRFSQN